MKLNSRLPPNSQITSHETPKVLEASSLLRCTSGFDELISHRITYQFAQGMKVEFAHHVGPVRFRRFYTDI